jgi:phenylacetate-coenzyme A ligase PaaK-like adenylate-forming protein
MNNVVNLEELLLIEPYSLAKVKKEEMLSSELKELTKWHYKKSEKYKKMMDAIGLEIDNISNYIDLPFLPVRMFKELELLSVPKEDIVKTMTSSGTSGQQVSKIFLDRETSAYQTKVLTKIVASFLGKKRLPMLILDSASVIKDRAMFSARGAGILGFSMFGSKRLYALDENMQLDIENIKSFLEEHKGETIFMFGFTFMVWQHFFKELLKSGYKPDLSNGVLIHGGGWKKLQSESVSSVEFKAKLHDICGINVSHIHDYYGMVEQTGTIYMECEYGHLHASVFSDIIVRRPIDFSVADFGEKGIIEVVSLLPKSYPGHALLTEDEGVVIGEDDCPCGRLGKYFNVIGRIKNAEIRGCSDTYATKFK